VVEIADTPEVFMMRGGGKAPRQITWVICLALYLVALLAHFGVVRVGGDVAQWSWIIGYGLLLVAVQLRGV
jgi:hypothetical protein